MYIYIYAIFRVRRWLIFTSFFFTLLFLYHMYDTNYMCVCVGGRFEPSCIHTFDGSFLFRVCVPPPFFCCPCPSPESTIKKFTRHNPIPVVDPEAREAPPPDPTSMFGIFDGHGGAFTSAFCARELMKCLQATAGWKSGNRYVLFLFCYGVITKFNRL